MDVPENEENFDGPLKTFNIFKDTSKPVRLSLHLIVKRNLPTEAQKWSQEQIVTALSEITHLRLDRENIREIDSLELLGENVKNVYLQQNNISKIENLECLRGLKFLSLAGNCIERVENLTSLINLRVLDLSHNKIDFLQTEELPKSLIILNLEHNPCTDRPGYSEYRERLINYLPNLLQLDGEDVKRPDDQDNDEGIIQDEESNHSLNSVSVSSSDTDVRLIAGEMLMRSQDRIESSQDHHARHIEELDELRRKHNVVKR